MKFQFSDEHNMDSQASSTLGNHSFDVPELPAQHTMEYWDIKSRICKCGARAWRRVEVWGADVSYVWKCHNAHTVYETQKGAREALDRMTELDAAIAVEEAKNPGHRRLRRGTRRARRG